MLSPHQGSRFGDLGWGRSEASPQALESRWTRYRDRHQTITELSPNHLTLNTLLMVLIRGQSHPDPDQGPRPAGQWFHLHCPPQTQTGASKIGQSCSQNKGYTCNLLRPKIKNWVTRWVFSYLFVSESVCVACASM